MTPYVVFDTLTGEALRWGNCQPDMVEAQAGAGETALATDALTVEGNRPALWEQVKAKREERYNAGIVTPFGTLDTNPDSREKILGLFTDAVSRVATGNNKDRQFTKTDETQVTLSSVQLVAVGQLVVDYIDAVHQHSQVLRIAINAAADMADLLSIDIQQGWP